MLWVTRGSNLDSIPESERRQVANHFGHIFGHAGLSILNAAADWFAINKTLITAL